MRRKVPVTMQCLAQHLGGGTGGPDAGGETGTAPVGKAGCGKGEEKGSFSETSDGGKRSWKSFVAAGRMGELLLPFSEDLAATIFLQRQQGFSPEKVSETACESVLS